MICPKRRRLRCPRKLSYPCGTVFKSTTKVPGTAWTAAVPTFGQSKTHHLPVCRVNYSPTPSLVLRRSRSVLDLADSTDYAEDDSGPGHYVSHWGTVNTGGFWGDIACKGSADPAWGKTDMGWSIVPWGFRKLLLWIQARYRWVGLLPRTIWALFYRTFDSRRMTACAMFLP